MSAAQNGPLWTQLSTCCVSNNGEQIGGYRVSRVHPTVTMGDGWLDRLADFIPLAVIAWYRPPPGDGAAVGWGRRRASDACRIGLAVSRLMRGVLV